MEATFWRATQVQALREQQKEGNEAEIAQITEELLEAINKLKLGKAPAQDEITVEMIQFMRKKWKQTVLNINNFN